MKNLHLVFAAHPWTPHTLDLDGGSCGRAAIVSLQSSDHSDELLCAAPTDEHGATTARHTCTNVIEVCIMFKFLASTVGILSLIGLLVVIGILALIF